ncbi:hypothetical protein CgunFtcFv8_014944 [Champsocephalus gunnari]|uniref:Uncharacterized protein n=1 Tax=Champsocephalus gunnari TaxID=52237 RepID=A0AAN8ICH8_CHAGU|nr:hypothetical protein CgunFtcFv8_014944 [Champsocephalus gunnari]
MMERQRRGGKQTSDAKRCDTVALMGESQTCLVPSKRLAVSRPGARQLVSQLKGQLGRGRSCQWKDELSFTQTQTWTFTSFVLLLGLSNAPQTQPVGLR